MIAKEIAQGLINQALMAQKIIAQALETWAFSWRRHRHFHGLGIGGHYEHGGTRTPDIQNRNLTLYPTELHAHRRENTRRRSPAEIGIATHLLA